MLVRNFKKILVTGGAGFIGSHFVDLCLSKNIFVHNYDALKTGSMLEHGPGKQHPCYHFSPYDISNSSLLIPDDIEAVVHFAAETHVDRSVTNPFSFVQSNVVGTYNLLEKCKDKNIWFHLVSTDEVYGDIHGTKRSTETDPINCSSPYSATKSASEQLVIAYGRTYGLKYTITRGCNTVGGRQNNEKLIPKFVHNAKNNLPLPVYGNGEAIRQYIHVTDHAEAIYAVLTKGMLNNIFNVGTDAKFSINEIVNIIRELYPNLTTTDKEDRPGHDLRYCMNWGLIQAWLSWQPKIKGKDIILRAINEM
jgi:dTDP-glucose 4,6-dehydratase